MSYKKLAIVTFCALSLCAAVSVSVVSSAFAQVESVPQGGGAQEKKTEGKQNNTTQGKPAAEEEEEKEVVRKGVIASSARYGNRDTTVDSGDGSAPGEEATVITGGVSRINREECSVTMMNSSKKNSYSVSYRVIGRDSRGNKVMSKSFSNSIPPGGRVSRDVSCRNDINMEVELTSATKR